MKSKIIVMGKIIVEPTLRHRAILGAFVFFPNWSNYTIPGMQARHINKVSTVTFKQLYRNSDAKTATASLGIQTSCMQMVRLGWLRRIATVPAHWIATIDTAAFKVGDQVDWDSPVYAPTEAGLMYALSQLDPQYLPAVRGTRRYHKTIRTNASLTTPDDTLFMKYIQFDREEARQLKYIHMNDE